MKRVYFFDDQAFPEPRMLALKDANAYEAKCEPGRISSTQLAILIAIKLLGKSTSTSLASRLQTDRPTVSKNLRHLEAIKALTIDKSISRGEQVIQLTKYGTELRASGLKAWVGEDPA